MFHSLQEYIDDLSKFEVLDTFNEAELDIFMDEEEVQDISQSMSAYNAVQVFVSLSLEGRMAFHFTWTLIRFLPPTLPCCIFLYRLRTSFKGS